MFSALKIPQSYLVRGDGGEEEMIALKLFNPIGACIKQL